MSLDPTDPRPPYRQIADQLRQVIYSGELAPGSQLPSERELVERYGTARQTARQAINLLKTEGLAVGRTGRGVFVRERPPLLLRLEATRRFISQAKAQGRSAEARLLDVRSVSAPVEVAAKLNTDPASQVLLREYLVLLDDEPVHVARNYWPPRFVDDKVVADPNDVTPGEIDRDLKSRFGIDAARFEDELTVRMPTAEEMRTLRLLPGTPVINLLRVYHTSADEPYEVTHFVLAGDRQVLIYGGNPTER